MGTNIQEYQHLKAIMSYFVVRRATNHPILRLHKRRMRTSMINDIIGVGDIDDK